MIRITGGRSRGQVIHCPKGQAIRPTTAFVRESLFSILGPRIIEARVLDLFAGCGIVGFEALSRGAAFVQAIERAPAHCRILEQNREKLHWSPQTYQIIRQDVFTWIERMPSPVPDHHQFEIVFLDPPYGLSGVEAVVGACLEKQVVAPDGLIILESRAKTPPEPLAPYWIETREYGASKLQFFKPVVEA